MRSMSAVAVALGWILWAQPAAGQYPYNFAGIEDRATAETVQTALAGIGFELDHTDEDGDLWFTGTLLGSTTEVVVFLTPARRLTKIIVNLQTPDEDAVSTYERMRKTLTEKYGEANTTVEEYEAPYSKGSGNQQEAIREGKANIASLWNAGEDGESGMLLRVSERLTVEVVYEYPSWSAEVARRQEGQARIF